MATRVLRPGVVREETKALRWAGRVKMKVLAAYKGRMSVSWYRRLQLRRRAVPRGGMEVVVSSAIRSGRRLEQRQGLMIAIWEVRA